MAYEDYDRDEDPNVVVERMKKYRDKHKTRDLKALAQALQGVKKAKEVLEGELKELNAEYDVLRFELVPEAMENGGIASGIRFDGIGQIVLLADLRVSCKKAQKPSLFSWFKQHKLKDLIREDINASTLTAWCKQRIKDGKELPPSDLVSVTPVTKASLRK